MKDRVEALNQAKAKAAAAEDRQWLKDLQRSQALAKDVMEDREEALEEALEATDSKISMPPGMMMISTVSIILPRSSISRPATFSRPATT